MANPCMVCGDEISDEIICDDCGQMGNATACKIHEILYWYEGGCPMCAMGLPATPFIRGDYVLPGIYTPAK